jgi:hypothetical protein
VTASNGIFALMVALAAGLFADPLRLTSRLGAHQ